MVCSFLPRGRRVVRRTFISAIALTRGSQLQPERGPQVTSSPRCAPVARGEGERRLEDRRLRSRGFPTLRVARTPQPSADVTLEAFLPPPQPPNPHTSTPTLCASECPRSPHAPLDRKRRRRCLAEGTREGAGGTRMGAPGGRARGPGRPGSAGRHGERATLTRCCCRLLTATAAADAALCRSSAACPGLSRLRVNLRVRSPAIACRAVRAGARSARPAGLPRANLLYPPAVQEAELGASPPLFLALLARGGFFSRAPPLPHPLPSTEASRRLCKLCAPRARAANSASGPGLAAAASRQRGLQGARGAAPAGGPGCPYRPGDGGRGGGLGAAASGLRAGPTHASRPHLEAPRTFGSLAAFAGLPPYLSRQADGRGLSGVGLSILRRRSEANYECGAWDLSCIARARLHKSS